DSSRAGLGSLCFFTTCSAAASGSAKHAGKGAQVVEKSGPTLGAIEATIERCHRPVEPLLLVIHPNGQYPREHERGSLRAQRAARTGRTYAGGLEHPMLRSNSHRVQSKSEPRASARRAHDRTNCFLVGGKGFQSPHQYVEKAFACRLLGH